MTLELNGRFLPPCLGTMDVLRKLLAEDGARGLYKGAVPVLLRLKH